jgi:acyl homoserine lactone synthase
LRFNGACSTEPIGAAEASTAQNPNTVFQMRGDATMVDVFSLRTAHSFGDALASQARLRYRVFVQHRKLDHPAYDGMEYDEFDTPGAVYFVWRDDRNVVRGLIRLLPTTLPYMLQKYWPHLAGEHPLPNSEDIWEVTRLCVDREFQGPVRQRIMPEIMCAVQEYCKLAGISQVVGVTQKHLIGHFLREGVKWLGPTDIIEGELEAAFSVAQEHMRPSYHCRKFGIGYPCLNVIPNYLIAA